MKLLMFTLCVLRPHLAKPKRCDKFTRYNVVARQFVTRAGFSVNYVRFEYGRPFDVYALRHEPN